MSISWWPGSFLGSVTQNLEVARSLGGGLFKYFCFFFSPRKVGEISNLTCAYFSVGWLNHQPDHLKGFSPYLIVFFFSQDHGWQHPSSLPLLIVSDCEDLGADRAEPWGVFHSMSTWRLPKRHVSFIFKVIVHNKWKPFQFGLSFEILMVVIHNSSINLSGTGLTQKQWALKILYTKWCVWWLLLLLVYNCIWWYIGISPWLLIHTHTRTYIYIYKVPVFMTHDRHHFFCTPKTSKCPATFVCRQVRAVSEGSTLVMRAINTNQVGYLG